MDNDVLLGVLFRDTKLNELLFTECDCALDVLFDGIIAHLDEDSRTVGWNNP